MSNKLAYQVYSIKRARHHRKEFKNLSDQDKKIFLIQRGTKTSFKVFAKPHNKLRARYKWYANWHSHPHHKKVHFGALTACFIGAGLFVYSFYGNYQTAKGVDTDPGPSFPGYDWNLSAGTAGNYTFSSNEIENTTPGYRLKKTDHTDTDNSTATFDGAHSNTETLNNKVSVVSGQTSGTYTSSVIDATQKAKLSGLNFSASNVIDAMSFDSPAELSATNPFTTSDKFAGDFDGDGHMDFVGMNSSRNAITWYKGTESGYVAENIRSGAQKIVGIIGLGGPNPALLIRTCDNIMCFTPEASVKSIGVLYFSSDEWHYETVYEVPTSYYGPPSIEAYIAGDFQPNQKNDIYYRWGWNYYNWSYKWLSNQSSAASPSFETSDVSFNEAPIFGQIADFNNDNLPDIYNGTDGLLVGINDGVEFSSNYFDFLSVEDEPSLAARNIKAADIDGDDYEDIIFYSNTTDHEGLYWMRNDGSGSFTGYAYLISNFTTSDGYAKINTYDMNGDGALEIIVAGSGWGLKVYKNPTNPDNIIETVLADSTEMNPGSFLNDSNNNIVDMDGDDLVDVVYLNHSSHLSWVKNTSTSNKVYLQVRGCDTADCSGAGDFVGPSGSSSFYETPGENIDLTGLNISNRYFQYRATLQNAVPETVLTLDSVVLTWFTTPPSSVLKSPAYNNEQVAVWHGFTATVSDESKVKFQFSNDEGATWKHYNDGWVAAESGNASQANALANGAIDLTSFPDNDGSFSITWQAILESDGSEQTNITAAGVTYKTDIEAPFQPTLDSSNLTMDNLGRDSWADYDGSYIFRPTVGEDVGSAGTRGYFIHVSNDDTVPTGKFNCGYINTSFNLTSANNENYCYISESNIDELTITNSSKLDGTKYIWLQAADYQDNFSQPEEPLYTLNLFNADTKPTTPTTLSVSPSSSKTQNFVFNWEYNVVDNAVNGYDLNGYEYRIGWETGDGNISTKDWQPAGALLSADQTSYTFDEERDESSLDSTHHVYLFQIRAKNVGGTVSNTAQTTFYYNPNPVNPPTTVTSPNKPVDPEEDNHTNSYKFTWGTVSPSVGGSKIVKYIYDVDSNGETMTPSIENPGSSHTRWGSVVAPEDPTVVTTLSSPTGAFAARQGNNKFCVVAVDENNNSSTPLCISFTFTSPAPTAPSNLKSLDISDRDKREYSVLLKWNEPEQTNGMDVKYNVYRKKGADHPKDVNNISTSDCGEISSYTKISSEISSKTFVDDDSALSDNQYCYYIESVDNSNQSSEDKSNIVTLVPVGVYTKPPVLDGDIAVDTKAFSSTVSWKTKDNEDPEENLHYAKGSILFGVSSDNLSGYADKTVPSEVDFSSSHSITVKGLSAGTKYYYQVIWTDEDGNEGRSDVSSFTTKDRPTVSDVAVPSQYITLNSAQITYKTNVPATTEILYGISQSLSGEPTGSKSGYTTDHVVNLTGLENSTKYYFKIVGTDQDGNSIDVNQNNDFKTLTMPLIDGTVAMDQDKEAPTTTYRFSWKTNIKTTSVIYYSNDKGQTQSSSLPDMTTDHSMTIANLADQSTYAFKVTGVDEHGISVNNVYETSLTTPQDTRAPKVSNMTVEIKSSGFGETQKAQIVATWETDEPSSSQIEYDLGISGDSYANKSKADMSYSTSHVVILSDLEPSKIYHLRAISADASGNIGYSEDTTTITGKMQNSILDIIINSLERSLGWLFGIFSN